MDLQGPEVLILYDPAARSNWSIASVEHIGCRTGYALDSGITVGVALGGADRAGRLVPPVASNGRDLVASDGARPS